MPRRKPPRTGVLPGARPLKASEKAVGVAAAALGAANAQGAKAAEAAVKTRSGIRYALIPAAAGFGGGFAAGRSIKKSAFGVPIGRVPVRRGKKVPSNLDLWTPRKATPAETDAWLAAQKAADDKARGVSKGQLPGWGLYKGRRVKVLGYQGQNHAEVLDRGQRVGTHTKHITFLPDKPKPPKKKPFEQGELF